MADSVNLVAQNMKAHNIAEWLIVPAEKPFVGHLIREKKVAKLNSLSLSNDIEKRRIKEMSVDIPDQVTVGVRSSKVWVCNKS